MVMAPNGAMPGSGQNLITTSTNSQFCFRKFGAMAALLRMSTPSSRALLRGHQSAFRTPQVEPFRDDVGGTSYTSPHNVRMSRIVSQKSGPRGTRLAAIWITDVPGLIGNSPSAARCIPKNQMLCLSLVTICGRRTESGCSRQDRRYSERSGQHLPRPLFRALLKT